MQAHEDALDRFQVFGFEHISRDLERVNPVTRRERIGEIAQGIPFVVVGNGIREVDGISRVRLQRVLQFDEDTLACRLDLRLFQLGRRDDDIIRSILNLDKLVEENLDLAGIHVDSLIFRLSPDDLGRRLIIPSTVGVTHLGTRRDNANDDDNED